MLPSALPLLTSRERDEARRLIEHQGLSFEDGCDEMVGLFDEGRLVATAARAGDVLKLYAIDEAYQGGDALGQLTGALIDSARRAGHDSVFVYTRPRHAASFEACNFRLLVECGEVALLEHGGGLERYLAQVREGLPRRSAEGAESAKAGVVINGNPFTRGHLHLVETAAAQAGTVYLFVVREDRSAFPFAQRFRMAREATRHLPNVVVLHTGRYAVSAATFPSYFLRKDPGRHTEAGPMHGAPGGAGAHHVPPVDHVARLQMQVDARVFGAHIAPALGIEARFVGDEPLCPTTAAYNEVLAEVLPQYGVAVHVVPRLRDEAGVVSATRVRAALAAGDLEAVGRLVPEETLALIKGAGREGRT